MVAKKGFVFDDVLTGSWFDHEDGWSVCLRVCTLGELNRIRKDTVQKKVSYKKVEGTPHRFLWEESDDEKQSQLIWDYCIVDWKEVFAKGEPLPCTMENKHMLMQGSAEFAKFVTDSMKVLNKDEEGQKTESEKNL